MTRSFLLELQPNSGTHHCVTGEVYVRIVVNLPKPFRTIIISADAGRMDKLTGILMSGLKDAVEGDAIVGVQFVPVHDVGVLLLGVESHINNRIRLDAIVAADFVPDSELHRVARIPEQIEEGLQICPRDSYDRKRLSRAQLRVERCRYGLGRGDLDRRHKVKPCSLVVVLRANANQFSAIGIGEAGNPGSQGTELMSQVEIV